jgi:hypothetical protein
MPRSSSGLFSSGFPIRWWNGLLNLLSKDILCLLHSFLRVKKKLNLQLAARLNVIF